MYTEKNYPTAKAVKDDFKAGVKIQCYQPGGIFPGVLDGQAFLEGPHYPKPHKWYLSVILKDGAIVKIR